MADISGISSSTLVSNLISSVSSATSANNSTISTTNSQITSSPAYALSDNLATMDLSLLQDMSSNTDDSFLYNSFNNLNFLSSSTYKSLVTATIANASPTSNTTTTSNTSTDTSSNTAQFNPVEPFANDSSSAVTYDNNFGYMDQSQLISALGGTTAAQSAVDFYTTPGSAGASFGSSIDMSA